MIKRISFKILVCFASSLAFVIFSTTSSSAQKGAMRKTPSIQKGFMAKRDELGQAIEQYKKSKSTDDLVTVLEKMNRKLNRKRRFIIRRRPQHKKGRKAARAHGKSVDLAPVAAPITEPEATEFFEAEQQETEQTEVVEEVDEPTASDGQNEEQEQ